MNYVYLMLLQTVLGRDRTDEAKQFLADSYELSPTNPITYVLDSVTELYRGNLQEAHRLMDTAVLLAPEARFTQATSAFLDQQIKSYPNLSPLLLENL